MYPKQQREMDSTVKKVWKGMIPIELQLAAADSIELLASATLPEPFQTFYMVVPRVSYLPFMVTKIKEQWLNPMLEMAGTRVPDTGTVIKETDVWFEYQKQPLKWHYPVGLLYDMLVNDASSELPWALTLHVRKFPLPALVPGPSIKAMRDMFMAMVKEADFIRNGSTKRVMDLAKSDQMQLLDGIQDHSFEKYFAIHSIIVTVSTGNGNNSKQQRGGGGPKAIPMRFYMASETQEVGGEGGGNREAAASGGSNGMAQFHILQYPVPLAKDESEQTTLADAFRICYEIPEQAGDAFVTNCACLCQGISVPWETPVSWLAENLFYADCFLHLVVANISK
ncbi:autophagy protein 5 [Coemansia sp. RSA 2399]|nr:autophagy protein 5 [Coemansia sp. RSA 2399]KAJ1903583.1 autophagy protein 5 [Coemansia sp. IMI 209127]